MALREAIRAGRLAGPRVVAAGPWLGATGGTCDFNGIGVRGADEFRRRVREDVERGADLIKVCASGWLADAVTAPAEYEITADELRAAIQEAHRLDTRVAVHALSEAAIDLSVRLGADLIAHAGFPSRAAVAIMKARSVFQVPTLFSLSTAKPEHLSALTAAMRESVAAGLPVAFGTDAGVIPHGANAREFEYLASIGLDPAAAIQSATVSAAAAVGMPSAIGTLSPDRLADVIGVRGNPLEDPGSLQRVTFVMTDGRVVKTASPAPPVMPRR